MPPTQQEQRCIDLAMEHLSSTIGRDWNVVNYPDEEFANLATPEVVVSNGNTTAAIEVKRRSDPAFQDYTEAMLSNHEFLVPSCGGYYTLAPAMGVGVRWDTKIRRHVQNEIERVAQTLETNVPGVILMPRQGIISLDSETDRTYIHCFHSASLNNPLLRPLYERVTGTFMLVDEGPPHSFYTATGRAAFHDAVVGAWKRRVTGDASLFTWNEEWQLIRLPEDDEDDEEGVYVSGVSEVRDMAESASDVVDAVLKNVRRKFSARPWADHHVLVMEGSSGNRANLIQQVFDRLEPDELQNIDVVLLVDGDRVIKCYP